MPKKPRKVHAGKAVANSKKLPKRSASAVAKGAAYAVIAGRPSKQAVAAVFGKSGYAIASASRQRNCATDSRLTPTESTTPKTPVRRCRRPQQIR